MPHLPRAEIRSLFGESTAHWRADNFLWCSSLEFSRNSKDEPTIWNILKCILWEVSHQKHWWAIKLSKGAIGKATDNRVKKLSTREDAGVAGTRKQNPLLICLSTVSFLKNPDPRICLLFLDREERRERETLISCPCTHTNQGSNLQPNYVLWSGIEPTIFWVMGQCSNQKNHPARALTPSYWQNFHVRWSRKQIFKGLRSTFTEPAKRVNWSWGSINQQLAHCLTEKYCL